jgi:hypothetical protein
VAASLRLSFVEHEGKTVAMVEVQPRSKPTWLTERGAQQFFVRLGTSSQPLLPEDAFSYVREHWPES